MIKTTVAIVMCLIWSEVALSQEPPQWAMQYRGADMECLVNTPGVEAGLSRGGITQPCQDDGYKSCVEAAVETRWRALDEKRGQLDRLLRSLPNSRALVTSPEFDHIRQYFDESCNTSVERHLSSTNLVVSPLKNVSGINPGASNRFQCRQSELILGHLNRTLSEVSRDLQFWKRIHILARYDGPCAEPIAGQARAANCQDAAHQACVAARFESLKQAHIAAIRNAQRALRSLANTGDEFVGEYTAGFWNLHRPDAFVRNLDTQTEKYIEANQTYFEFDRLTDGTAVKRCLATEFKNSVIADELERIGFNQQFIEEVLMQRRTSHEAHRPPPAPEESPPVGTKVGPPTGVRAITQ